MVTKNSEPVTFGEMLRAFRKRRHLTQQQLAEMIGRNRHAITRWEQGDFLPANKTLVLELARYLLLDDQEASRLLEASFTAPSPHWMVPLPRNPFFTGREEVLEALLTQLDADQAVALTQSSALHGLGGVGKTQIALEYAYRYALKYSAIFWIGAETEESIVASLLHIAEVLQLPERGDKDQQRVVTAFQNWLSTHKQWLLIWDNVEDFALLDRFLPATRSGTILLTTRHQVLGTRAQGFNLAPMEHEEGILFLLRRAKVLSPKATSEQVHQLATQIPAQYAAASELVTILGALPLALDQAGAYLEETHCGVSTYLDLFRTRRTILLQQRGDGARDHPASVSTTFTLAIMLLAEIHPAALDLLRVCALLQADAIPEELFCQGGEHLGPMLEAACRDPLAWNRVVGNACSYSLLSRQPEERLLSIHRLVQAVLLDGMTEREQELWNRRAIEALDAVFPAGRYTEEPMTEYALEKRLNRLLPHALCCLHQTRSTSRSLAHASLAYKTAFVLHKRARYAEAEALHLQALQIREQALGPDHPEVASSLHYLAALNWMQGRYTKAEALHLRTLQIQEQALGPNHLEVAGSLNNLAILYADQGKHAEAEQLHLRALQIREQALGPGDPRVAGSLNNLALLYEGQGRYAEAEPLYLRALQIQKQALGPDHPDVAFSLTNLANLYQEQDHYAEAWPLYLEALHIWELALGPDHLYLADPLSGLANLYREQGQYQEAEAFYHRTLSIREQHLGQQHSEFAQTLQDLALLRQKQGNLCEAISLAERAFSIRSQSLGDTHPKTIATRTLYTQLLQEQIRVGAQKDNLFERSAERASDTHQDERPAGKAPHLSSTGDESLQGFLDNCCELHPRAWCRISDLWQAYEQWTKRHQERFPLSRRAFATQVQARGCRVDRTSTARIWRGITLLNNEL